VYPKLERALAPILRDLRAAGGPLPRIVGEDWAGDPDTVSAMLYGDDGGGMGVFVRLDEPLPEQVARVSDQVHDWAVEELWGRRPTNWPPCPRHPGTHPMAVSLRNDVPTWVCPRDGTPVGRVGELG
jgi:hypothetical protein